MVFSMGYEITRKRVERISIDKWFYSFIDYGLTLNSLRDRRSFTESRRLAGYVHTYFRRSLLLVWNYRRYTQFRRSFLAIVSLFYREFIAENVSVGFTIEHRPKRSHKRRESKTKNEGSNFTDLVVGLFQIGTDGDTWTGSSLHPSIPRYLQTNNSPWCFSLLFILFFTDASLNWNLEDLPFLKTSWNYKIDRITAE